MPSEPGKLRAPAHAVVITGGGGGAFSDLSPNATSASWRIACKASWQSLPLQAILKRSPLRTCRRARLVRLRAGTGPRPEVRLETSQEQENRQAVCTNAAAGRAWSPYGFSTVSMNSAVSDGAAGDSRSSAETTSEGFLPWSCCCLAVRPRSASRATSSRLPPTWAHTAAAMAPSTSGAGHTLIRLAAEASNSSRAVWALSTALPKSINTSRPSGQAMSCKTSEMWTESVPRSSWFSPTPLATATGKSREVICKTSSRTASASFVLCETNTRPTMFSSPYEAALQTDASARNKSQLDVAPGS